MITDGIAVEVPDPESLTADYHIGEHDTGAVNNLPVVLRAQESASIQDITIV
jgi:hypothetical protein